MTESQEDYWFRQRCDDLMFDEHTKGHPRSDSTNCIWCDKQEADDVPR